MTSPLSDIRVLDFTRGLAGPFCALILADLGADVIKIEEPGGGDEFRKSPPNINGESAMFMSLNRNKRSITLNLKSDKGKEITRKLVKDADVVLENFRPGVMDKLGLGYSSLRELNPKVVYCSLTGFGTDGPNRDLPAYDLVGQAYSGLLSLFVRSGEVALQPPLGLADLSSGLFATVSILAALNAARATGKGQRVESSLLEGSMAIIGYLASQYFATGEMLDANTRTKAVGFMGIYRASDDNFFVIQAQPDRVFERFHNVPELKIVPDDPRFVTVAQRQKNFEALTALFKSVFSQKPVAYWIETLRRADIPCAQVSDIKRVSEDPQVRHRQMILDIPHPNGGTVKQVGPPMKFSETPLEIRYSSPKLGQHTREVLLELGYSDSDYETFKSADVI